MKKKLFLDAYLNAKSEDLTVTIIKGQTNSSLFIQPAFYRVSIKSERLNHELRNYLAKKPTITINRLFQTDHGLKFIAVQPQNIKVTENNDNDTLSFTISYSDLSKLQKLRIQRQTVKNPSPTPSS